MEIFNFLELFMLLILFGLTVFIGFLMGCMYENNKKYDITVEDITNKIKDIDNEDEED